MISTEEAMVASLNAYQFNDWSNDLSDASFSGFNVLNIDVARPDFISEADTVGFRAIVYQRGGEIVMALMNGIASRTGFPSCRKVASDVE